MSFTNSKWLEFSLWSSSLSRMSRLVEKSRNSCALSMQVVCLIICKRAISFESKTFNNFFYGGFSLGVVHLGVVFLLKKFFKRFCIFSPNTGSFNICFYCYMDCGDMYVWFTIENSRLFLMILYVL